MGNNIASSQQLNSLEALMSESIDYAGIFPPGNLPLEEAISNYRQYLDENDAWMLRSFVLPISKLGDLEKHMDLFSNEKKVNLSLVVSKSYSAAEFENVCNEDSEELINFLNKFTEIASVESLEVPLPPVGTSKDILKNVSDLASTFKVKAFCEMTKPLSPDWVTNMEDTMEVIKEFNLENPEHQLGYKLRSGGIKAELFPSIQQAAATLTKSIKEGIPIKFTAGLHHPIRMYRSEVQTEMHGFLNIFMGYLFQNRYELDMEQVEEILRDENECNFEFYDDEIKWKNYKVNSKKIKNIRGKLLCSFGSCSFHEPREDLRNLNIMK